MNYEVTTCGWLFKPEVTDDIPCDIDRLAQMAQHTGQDHDDTPLK